MIKQMSVFLRIITILSLLTTFSWGAQTDVTVSNMDDFQRAITSSDQNITMTPGDYELTDLSSNPTVLNVSGSNNVINLTGVRIKALVGSIRETYFIITGDNNVLRNGIIEDYYKSGISDDITDYSAYNNDSDLAYGLKGAAVMSVYGNNNLVVGLELIVRGSDPYGYGSIYGIGKDHTFSINKRCGLLITGNNYYTGDEDANCGVGNILDSVTMHQNAFGHGIYVQGGADKTIIRNVYVEGRMRLSATLYNETGKNDLPFLSNYELAEDGTSYEMPYASAVPIPMDVMYPLSEDGIRMYGGTGSIVVENCSVKQMRGGIRTYLASKATVTNCISVSCGLSNYNTNGGGTITKSSGNFSYAPIMDVPLNKSAQKIDLTILPSPEAVGPHNIADIDGDGHTITFNRTPGPLDTAETRVIYITGKNSTIKNHTEYTIVLASGTSGNKITSCGTVIDNGSNTIIDPEDDDEFECMFDVGCGSPQVYETVDTFSKQAGEFEYAFEVETTGSVNNGVIGISADTVANAFSALSAIVQFNEDGTIKARNGAVYEAENVVNWGSDNTYYITMIIDIPNKIYSVSAAESGGTVVQIATDYAFRSDWEETNYLDRAIVKTANCPLIIFNSNLEEIEDTTVTNVGESRILASSNEKLKIYPNPFNDQFVIELPNVQSTTYTVYDITGKMVLGGKVNNRTSLVNMTSLPQGVYLIKVDDNTKIVYKVKK